MKPVNLKPREVRDLLDKGQATAIRPIRAPRLHAEYGKPDWANVFVDGVEGDQYIHLPFVGGLAGDTRHRVYPAWGHRGAELWVRESISRCGCKACWEAWPSHGPHRVVYLCDAVGPGDLAITASAHMPRWASRLNIRIASVEPIRLPERGWDWQYSIERIDQ